MPEKDKKKARSMGVVRQAGKRAQRSARTMYATKSFLGKAKRVQPPTMGQRGSQIRQDVESWQEKKKDIFKEL